MTDFDRDALLNSGMDMRNVRDRYKGKTQEEIVSEASQERSDLVICASNKIRDFNWGTVVRTANGLGAKKVVFTGLKRYDRRGAVGAHNYTDIEYIPNVIEAFNKYREIGYKIIAAEYDESREMTSLSTYGWDEKTLVIFGEEGVTLDDEILDNVDAIVAIPMFGTVRSLNVANCVGLFIYDYNTKTGRDQIK